MVSRIRFKNFKIFRQWQTLELRPITILIGKNNSGKSAVMKLPTMIAPALRGEPLNFINKIGDERENSVELGSDFKDLVYNRNNSGSIEIEIANEEYKMEVVINPQYGILEYKLNGEVKDVTPKIKGLLINGVPIPTLSLNLDYIGAIRAEPASVFSFSSENYNKIGIKGQNAYPILIQDFKNEKYLISKVSEWYRAYFEGWNVEVIESKISTETKYEVVISSGSLTINIRQTGQGIHQVLPLIVRSFMPENTPTLIIIEEPETHLHPAAHGILAQRFVESHLENNNRRYLIETHSQNFVLRMRRLVAEGKLKPEDLAIYYVEFDEQENESSLRRIEVDEDGEVNWWPEGIFDDTLEEVINLRKAQEL